ncbi:MAG: iron ABC transporter permease, partial [Actinobacteria bacterium]|nr:iron ABC transporter permease [Actinomycetota bacterium]
MRRRAPLLLAAPALVTVALVTSPLVYLSIRAATGGADAWRVLSREGTLDLVIHTATLVVAVV